MCICEDKNAMVCKAKRYGHDPHGFSGPPCKCSCHGEAHGGQAVEHPRAPDAGDSASFLNLFYPIFNLLNQVRRDPPQRR